jgi:lipopolysaccharide assembly outer membrane protein LptD (OstA)
VALLVSAPRSFAPARAADQPAASPARPPAAAPPQKKPKTYTLKHADHGNYLSATKTYHLTGNIVFVQDKVTMSMDQCDYNDANDTAVATGHLKITDPESTITGDLLKVDFGKKLAQISGNVKIVTQKKKAETPPAAADEKPGALAEYRQKLTTITCPSIDYYYAEDKKQATVAGPLQAVQDDKTVTADKAFYDGVKDEVTLEGNVRVVTEAGSEFRCPQVIISLQDDSFQADNVEGVAVEEKKPEETKPPAGGGTPPPPPPPAPPAP